MSIIFQFQIKEPKNQINLFLLFLVLKRNNKSKHNKHKNKKLHFYREVEQIAMKKKKKFLSYQL